MWCAEESTGDVPQAPGGVQAPGEGAGELPEAAEEPRDQQAAPPPSEEPEQEESLQSPQGHQILPVHAARLGRGRPPGVATPAASLSAPARAAPRHAPSGGGRARSPQSHARLPADHPRSGCTFSHPGCAVNRVLSVSIPGSPTSSRNVHCLCLVAGRSTGCSSAFCIGWHHWVARTAAALPHPHRAETMSNHVALSHDRRAAAALCGSCSPTSSESATAPALPFQHRRIRGISAGCGVCCVFVCADSLCVTKVL